MTTIAPFNTLTYAEVVMNNPDFTNNNKFYQAVHFRTHGVFMGKESLLKSGQRGTATGQMRYHRWLTETAPHIETKNGVPTMYYALTTNVMKKGYHSWRTGGFMVSNRHNLCMYISTLVARSKLPNGLNMNEPDVRKDAICFEAFNYQSDHRMYYFPYIDIDLYVDQDANPQTALQTLWSFILQKFVLTLGNDIRTQLGDNYDHVQIYHNIRTIDDRTTKISTHIHFYKVCVQDLGIMSCWIVSHSPPKPVYDSMTAQWAFPDDTNERLVDNKVYKHKQLMRTPFCAKPEHLHAELIPYDIIIDPHSSQCVCQPTNVDTTIATQVYPYVFRSCITTYERDSDSHSYFEPPVNAIDEADRGRPEVHVEDITSLSIEDNYVLDFWRPILRHIILPQWLDIRRRVKSEFGVDHACIPTVLDDQHLSSLLPVPQQPATYQMAITEDTLCVYDHGDTPNYHTGTKCVGYVIDFKSLMIAQNCKRCIQRGQSLQWHRFTEQNEFIVNANPTEDREPRKLKGKMTEHAEYTLVELHNRDNIVRSNSGDVYFWNEDDYAWTNTERTMNHLALQFREKTLKKYRDFYINVMYLSKLKQNYNDCWSAGIAVFRSLFEKQKYLCNYGKRMIDTCKFGNVIDRMEPYEYLVPMCNRKAYNVLTGAEIDIEKWHYFNSACQAHYIKDEHYEQYNQWQLQMCANDTEYAHYKRIIVALCFTQLTFDRRFYICQGKGKNGKGIESKLLLAILRDGRNNRAHTVSPNYFVSANQRRNAANSPDAETISFNGKTFLFCEEVGDAQLSETLLKAISSGDFFTARNLYSKDMITFPITASLWLTTNYVLKVDYSEKAILDRMVYLPYDVTFTTDAECNAKRSLLPSDQHHLWQIEDTSIKKKVTDIYKNACFTSCMDALTAYLQSTGAKISDNGFTIENAVPIPLPKRVREKTTAIIDNNHPTKAFVKAYLTFKTEYTMSCMLGYCITLDKAYQLFVYWQRRNNIKEQIDSSKFMDLLMKDGVEMIFHNDVLILKGYYTKVEIVLDEPPHKQRRVTADAYV